MKRYVVVGGGLAGLTAANELAGEGHQVSLLEQAEELGGRARTQQDRGYLLNFGPHALSQGGVTARMLRQWGVPFEGKPPDTSSASFLVRGGRMYPLVYTVRGLLSTRLFSPIEKVQAARVLQQMLTSEASNGEAIGEWIESHSRSPRVREFAAMLVRLSTFSCELSQMSARAALGQYRLAATQGVLYLDGGWGTLIRGLERRARRLGVAIRVGVSVNRLAQLQADGIVLAVPPAAVERMTGRALPPTHPVRLACLDLGLRRMPEGAARIALGVDRPLYLSTHSVVAALAPAGKALVHVAKYLSGATDAASDRRELEQFADLAIPGWRDEAEVVRFLPQMIVTSAIRSPQGRPSIDELGIPGVALAGEWVGPEGMLADAAVASALAAAVMVKRQQSQAA